jgi:hypothetical protein
MLAYWIRKNDYFVKRLILHEVPITLLLHHSITPGYGNRQALL